MPEEYKRLDFDPDKWRRHESRIEMAPSIPNHFPLNGETFTDIKQLLGEPNQQVSDNYFEHARAIHAASAPLFLP